MPWVEALSDLPELRRCIRDLVALSTLPAIWTSYNPRQIADSMAAALLSMLAADFVHITLPSDNGEPPVETIHVKTSIGSDVFNDSRDCVDMWLGRCEQTASSPTRRRRNPRRFGPSRLSRGCSDRCGIPGAEFPYGCATAAAEYRSERHDHRFAAMERGNGGGAFRIAGRNETLISLLRASMAYHPTSIPPVLKLVGLTTVD